MRQEKTYVVSHVRDRPFELEALDVGEKPLFEASFPANQPPQYKFRSQKEPSIDEAKVRSAKDLLQIEDLGCENFREIEVPAPHPAGHAAHHRRLDHERREAPVQRQLDRRLPEPLVKLSARAAQGRGRVVAVARRDPATC